MTVGTTTPKPRIWLAAAAVLSVIAIGVLWPLQQVGQVCILIYPAPPGCGATEPRWVPFVAIGFVIALLAAAVIVYFTTPNPRVLVIVFAAAIVAVTLIAAAVVGLSQTGIWDPPQPLYITD
jgi:hypothetical protein